MYSQTHTCRVSARQTSCMKTRGWALPVRQRYGASPPLKCQIVLKCFAEFVTVNDAGAAVAVARSQRGGGVDEGAAPAGTRGVGAGVKLAVSALTGGAGAVGECAQAALARHGFGAVAELASPRPALRLLTRHGARADQQCPCSEEEEEEGEEGTREGHGRPTGEGKGTDHTPRTLRHVSS